MTKIIAISNHKGGVGKTTSSINISAGLNSLGKKVLLIDLDPQANATQSLGVPDHGVKNIYDALHGEYQLEPIQIVEGFDIIPSTLDLSGAEVELMSEPGREYLLKELLIEPIQNKYDYVIIDCAPSLGLLTINALTACNHVLIPLQAQFLAVQGVTKITDVIDKIKKRLNKELKSTHILITQYDSRKVLNRDVSSMVMDHFKESVLNTKIRDNVALAEAPTQGLDIFRYNPKSNGAEDYLNVAKEIELI